MSEKRWLQETLHGDVRVSFAADEVLVEEQSAHQHLALFKNRTFGDVLLLDGITQVTTGDEFIYHEMMAHVPLFAHGAPREVLIVGGGDGGLAEEVLKHEGVERVTLVEIDADVVAFAKRHMQAIHRNVFDDPRLEVVIADGCVFAAQTERTFDVVLVDSTDPVGPGEVLFRVPFYEDLSRVLNPGGLVVTQNGVPFLQPAEFKMGIGNLRRALPGATCYVIAVPTYFGGHMTLGYAGKPAVQVERDVVRERFAKAGLATRYYTPDVHVAAFALPAFIGDLLQAA